MPKIIIGNVDNESMIGDLRKITPALKPVTVAVAHRLLWLAEPEDILIMPHAVSKGMLAHALGVAGVQVSSERIVVPRRASAEPTILTSDELLAPDLLDRVRALMSRSSGAEGKRMPSGGGDSLWTVVSYYTTAGVARLARELDAELSGGGERFLEQGGAELFNSKSFFRKASAAQNFASAPGAVCVSLVQLERAVPDLIRETGSVILKEEFNAGGDGNVVVTLVERSETPGAAEVVHLTREEDVIPTLRRLWPRFVSGRNSEVIVESYYDARSVIYCEFEIAHDGRIRHLNHGGMRMKPLWCGFEIPGRLTPSETARFAAMSQELATFAREQGYRGRINFDALILADGRIVFSEFNGRLGGCTHIDVLVRFLLGDAYMDRVSIATLNRVASPSWLLLDHLLDQGYRFDPATGRGIVVLTDTLSLNGTIEIMAIDVDADAAERLESRFLAGLAAIRATDEPLRTSR